MTYLPWLVAALVAVVAFAWGSLRGQSQCRCGVPCPAHAPRGEAEAKRG